MCVRSGWKALAMLPLELRALFALSPARALPIVVRHCELECTEAEVTMREVREREMRKQPPRRGLSNWLNPPNGLQPS